MRKPDGNLLEMLSILISDKTASIYPCFSMLKELVNLGYFQTFNAILPNLICIHSNSMLHHDIHYKSNMIKFETFETINVSEF